MKGIGFLTLIILLISIDLHSQVSDNYETLKAEQVLKRVLGESAKAFEFEKIQQSEGLDAYEVHARNGKVKVLATSTVAMCHGTYDYLRKACHFQYTWSSNLPVPVVFPDFDIEKTTSPYRMRQYYNVCTYGYSTAFWGWDEWQRELDWMALHGINMPLAMTGQEAIWQKVWKSFGITDAELDEYFTGPAFLPWHRMGNVNKHGGPLPKSYLSKSMILQKQILNRMRELGMMPVVPAFSGYVPDALKRVMPDAGIIDMAPWCGFTKDYGTHILMPTAKEFTEIGKKFIEEYTKEYGKCKYYMADAFNEMKVPVKADKQKELAEFGSAIYQSINQADTDAVWVMQGWLFYNDKTFWDKSAVQAFLKKVPDNKMIIIDLANESFHGWKEQDGFYGKNWICSYIHNYGGRTQLGGDLHLFAKDAPEMLATPNHGKLYGFGISPEGINQNEVVYELLTDVAWTDKTIQLDKWIEMWCISRYGIYNQGIKNIWVNLLKSVYGSDGYHATNLYQLRPSLDINHKIYMPEELDSVLYSFTDSLELLLNNKMYEKDYREFQMLYFGNQVDFFLNKAIAFYKKNVLVKSQQLFKKGLIRMVDLDKFRKGYPENSLERWINLARKWGNTPEEEDYYEEQVKRQITVWGGPVLSEYACKTWSGLINSYYLQRWQIFYNSLFNNTKDTILKFEESWITNPNSYQNSEIENILFTGPLYYEKKDFPVIHQYLNYIDIKAENQKNGNFLITINSKDKNLDIYYTTDGSIPTIKSFKYNTPFIAKPSMIIKAQTFKNNEEYGEETELALSLSLNKKVTLKEEPDGKYKAEGSKSLTDGKLGTTDYTDGSWLGFEGKDMEAVIDLGAVQNVKNVNVNFLEDKNAWIFQPNYCTLEVSEDGISYIEPNDHSGAYIDIGKNAFISNKIIRIDEAKVRYLRIIAKNRGVCPEGHPGTGGKAWIFIDEITIN